MPINTIIRENLTWLWMETEVYFRSPKVLWGSFICWTQHTVLALTLEQERWGCGEGSHRLGEPLSQTQNAAGNWWNKCSWHGTWDSLIWGIYRCVWRSDLVDTSLGVGGGTQGAEELLSAEGRMRISTGWKGTGKAGRVTAGRSCTSEFRACQF